MENKTEYSLSELAHISAGRHKILAEKYREFIKNTPGAARKDYGGTERDLPDPNVFCVPAQYGCPSSLQINLPQDIVDKAKEICTARSHYHTKCMEDAFPGEEFYSFWHFHNWFVNNKCDTYITKKGEKITEHDVFTRLIDQEYKTREEYVPIVTKMAELMDGIASYLESIK